MIETSIIILAHGRSELTRACLRSLREHTPGAGLEVILFDNFADHTASRDLVALAWESGARPLGSGWNLGFAGGCNAAASEAGGSNLVFLNNDVIARPGWLPPLLESLADAEVGIAGPLLLLPDGAVQNAGIGLGLWGLPVDLERDAEPEQAVDGACPSPLGITGACMAVRAERFRKLGGFDRSFFFSYEDIDLCMRARLLGWRTRFRPESRMVHACGATSVGSPVHKLRLDAEEQFVKRWYPLLSSVVSEQLAGLALGGVRRVAIFGTGRAGQMMLYWIRELGLLDPACFLDSRSEFAGQALNGVPVRTPGSISPGEVDAVLEASMFYNQIRKIARESGLWDIYRSVLLPDIDDIHFLEFHAGY